MNLKRSSKVLITGCCLSLLLFAAGKLNTYRLQRHQSNLQAACEAGNRLLSPVNQSAADPVVRQRPDLTRVSTADLLAMKAGDLSKVSSEGLKALSGEALECDAKALVVLGVAGESNGVIQERIVDASAAVAASKSWPTSGVLIVLALSAVPLLWYAMLRRIGELRAAISGHPPRG